MYISIFPFTPPLVLILCPTGPPGVPRTPSQIQAIAEEIIPEETCTSGIGDGGRDGV